MKSDEGNVVVEFVGIVIGMLIPIIFVADACWSVAQAHLAMREAAVSSARGFVSSQGSSQGAYRMNAIVSDVVSQVGIIPSEVSRDISCSQANCLAGGTQVTVRLNYAVKFSLPIFGNINIPISDSHTEQVDEIK